MRRSQKAEIQRKIDDRHPARLLPQPKFRILQNDKADYFFEYWKNLSPEHVELCDVRAYRLWPVVDYKLVEPKRKDVALEIITGQPSIVENPANFRSEIMGRALYGSGEYRFIMKETGTSGNIMEAYVSAIDLARFPPEVDLRTLVNVHENREYVRSLRSRNIRIPWDSEDEEQDDMATEGLAGAVVGALNDAHKTALQAQREVTEVKLEALEQKIEERRDDGPDPEQGAAMGVLAEAQKQGMTLVSEAASASIQMMAKNAGQTYDPVAMMRAAKELMAGDAGMAVLLEHLRDQSGKLVTMQEKQFEFLKDFLEERSSRREAPDSLDSFLAQAEKFDRLKKVMGWDDREDRHERAEPVVQKPPEKSIGQTITENIVPILTMVTTIGAMAANVVFNLKAKSTAELRNPAEDISAAQRELQNNPMLQQLQQAQQQAQQQAAAAAPPAGAAQPAEQSIDLTEAARQFIPTIEEGFKRHFFEAEFNGYTFAEWIRSNLTGAGDNEKGLIKYATITETIGRAKFEELIREYIPLWSQLKGMPAKVKTFLDEFFSYEQWINSRPAGESSEEVAA